MEDITATYDELSAKGVEFNSPNTVDDGPPAGWRWAYFSDPDGHTIELVEVAYVRQEERTADLTAYLKGRAATRRSSGEG